MEGQRSAEEEGKGEEVDSQGEEGGGVDGQRFPKWRRAERDVAEQDDLKNPKRSGEKSGPEEREGDAEERSEREQEEREEDESVMKRDGALPGETGEERETFVFDIVGEGGEIENEEIGEDERGDRESEDREQTMKVSHLQDKTERWNNVTDMRGEEEFAETESDEFERRNGIGKNKEKRKREQDERRTVDASREEEDVGATRGETEQADGNKEQSITQVDAFGAEESVDRFIGGTEDFGQQVHADLREDCPTESQPERGGREGHAEVVRDGEAEGVGEGGEEEVEGAEESHQLSVIGFRRIGGTGTGWFLI